MVALTYDLVALQQLNVTVGGTPTRRSTTGAGVPSHHLEMTAGGFSPMISGTTVLIKPNIETNMVLRVVRSITRPATTN